MIQQMMATGIPVISTRHSDIPFIFGDCAPLLVGERQAGEIAEQLQRYYEDPQRLAEVGTQLSDQVRKHFDVRTRAASLSEIYESLINGTAGKG